MRRKMVVLLSWHPDVDLTFHANKSAEAPHSQEMY